MHLLHHHPIRLLQPGKADQLAVLFPKPRLPADIKHRVLIHLPHHITQLPEGSGWCGRSGRGPELQHRPEVRLATIRPRRQSRSRWIPTAARQSPSLTGLLAAVDSRESGNEVKESSGASAVRTPPHPNRSGIITSTLSRKTSKKKRSHHRLTPTNHKPDKRRRWPERVDKAA